MRQKEDRELLDMLFLKKDYQSKVYEAAISEIKRRGLKVKWDEINSFNAQVEKEVLLKDERDSQQKTDDIFIGGFFLAIGIIGSLVSYYTALPGGTYVVFSGAIAVGIYRIFR